MMVNPTFTYKSGMYLRRDFSQKQHVRGFVENTILKFSVHPFVWDDQGIAVVGWGEVQQQQT